jgi:hypothetical protein
MVQDIRELLKNDQKLSQDKMSKGHEARFLKKLEEELPKDTPKNMFTFFNVAASVVLLIGLTYGGYKLVNFNQNTVIPEVATNTVAAKTIGDVSPQLKKVEDYYLASINLELSKMKITSENKELFDGYLARLEDLNNEYNRLTEELIEAGPNEQTVNALIDNLKFRLNLLYRLKDKLNELNNSENNYEELQS